MCGAKCVALKKPQAKARVGEMSLLRRMCRITSEEERNEYIRVNLLMVALKDEGIRNKPCKTIEGLHMQGTRRWERELKILGELVRKGTSIWRY